MAESIIGLDRLEARLRAISVQKVGPDVMKLLGAAAVGEAKILAQPHRKTSHLEHSIKYDSVTATSVTVRATVPYARYVEEGTRPHEITPNARKALRWARSSSKGFRLSGKPSSAKGNVIGWAFAKRVHHPGTKAYPYLVPGARKALTAAKLTDRIVAAWNGAA